MKKVFWGDVITNAVLASVMLAGMAVHTKVCWDKDWTFALVAGWGFFPAGLFHGWFRILF